MSDQARDWELSFYNREDRIAELVDTNRLLCRDLDEAQRVVEARDGRIVELGKLIDLAETIIPTCQVDTLMMMNKKAEERWKALYNAWMNREG